MESHACPVCTTTAYPEVRCSNLTKSKPNPLCNMFP